MRLVLGRQRKMDFYEFQISLVYIVSPRSARTTQLKPCFKNRWRGWRDASAAVLIRVL